MDIREHINFGKNSDENSKKRDFLGIHFKCCNTYGRLYKNRQQNAYEGHCPICGKQSRIPIGKGGTASRFFTAE